MRTVMEVVPYYPPHLGGIEEVARHLAENLSRDHDVHVVTSAIRGDAPAHRAIPRTAVTVHRLRAVEIAHTVIAPGLPLPLLRAPQSAIVHVHLPHALVPEQVALAARLRGQRFLVHFHGDVGPAGVLGRLLPLYKRYVVTRVMKAAAAVIALTPDQAAYVHDVHGVPAERIYVVPNGVGPQFFRPAPEPRTEPGTASTSAPLSRPESERGALKLLFVGRLNVQKNVDRLLDAVSLTEEPVHVTIVGDGDLRDQLHAKARDLGLSTGRRPRVRFAGTLHDSDLVKAYHEADAFVLPSNSEGMALVALEAMASALPIVATDVTGNHELLRDVGLLVEPDPRQLARAIDELARSTDLRHRLALRSARAATAYSWDTVADQIRGIYADVYGAVEPTASTSLFGATR